MKEIVGNRLCWDHKRHSKLAKIKAITKVLIYLSTKCDFLLGLRFGNIFCRFNTHLPWLICHRWVVPNEWSVKIFGNQITFRRQAIIRINAAILLIEPLWTKFSEIAMHAFSLKKMHLKMSSAKWHFGSASMCLRFVDRGTREFHSPYMRLYALASGLCIIEERLLSSIRWRWNIFRTKGPFTGRFSW